MKNKIKWLLICTEIIIMVVCIIIGCIKKPAKYEFQGSDLYSSQVYTTENNVLCLYPSGLEEASYIYTPDIELKRGCYKVDFEYATDTEDIQYEFLNNYYSYFLLHYDEGICLNSHSTSQTAHVRSFYSVPYFQVCLIYSDVGELDISSITITETKEFAVWGCILLGLFFIVVDLWLYLKKNRAEVKVKNGRILETGILGSIQPWKIILLITLLSCLPLLSDYLIKGHDLEFHLLRIEGIKDGLLSGQFPVRIHPTHMNGYGYPTSIYYPELFLYFPALLRMTGLSVINCYKALLVLINLATALFSYKTFTAFTKDKRTGLLGCAIYTLSLYRMVNVYLRCAVGESIAMIFIPPLLLAFFNLITVAGEDRKQLQKSALLIIVCVTGILQSHVLSMEMVGFFAFFLCVVYIKELLYHKKWLYLIGSTAFCVLLNAEFIVPLIQYMRLDIVLNSFGTEDICKYALHPVQILFPFPKIEGFSKPLPNGMLEDMPFGLGFLFTLGLVGVFVHWKYIREVIRQKSKFPMVCFVLAIISLWLTTYFFPWSWIYAIGGKIARILQMVQFPWRYLGLATVFLVVVFAFLYQSIEREKAKKYIFTGVLAFTVFSGVVFTQQYFQNDRQYWIYDTEKLLAVDFSNLEYLYTNTDADEAIYYTFDANDQDPTISYDKKGSNATVHVLQAFEQSRNYMLPMFYYPCYSAFDAGNGEAMELQKGENGKIELIIPSDYEGDIRVFVKEQPLWIVCDVVSLLSLIALGVYYFLFYKREKAVKGK